MKAIGYILLSYFQQSPIIHFVIATITFAIATIWTLWLPFFTMNAGVGIKWNRPRMIEDPWVIFLVALVYLVISMGSHLTRLLKSNASALVPYYRQKQLVAAGILLIAFIVWPTAITGYHGFPILPSLAMFLFATGLVLWSSFNFPQNIISLTIIIWLLRLAYELLGLPTDFKIMGTLSDFALFSSNYIFSIFLIIVSCISLTYFVKYFLNISILNFSKEEYDNSAPESTINHDRVDPLVAKFITRNLARLFAQEKEQKSSIIHIVRLIQFSLFTPSYVVFFLSSVIYLGMLFFIVTHQYLSSGQVPGNYVLAFLFMAYPLYAVQMTTDFLQHRNRMPAIWLRAQCASRKEFTKATIFAYLLVMGKQYISISLINFFILLIIPTLSLAVLIPIMAVGFIVFVSMLSLSLIFSNKILSSNCKGWLISTATFWIITSMSLFGWANNAVSLNVFPLILRLSIPGLLIISMGVFFIWILFRIGVRKWANTEMDFSGPEISTSW